MTGIYKLYWADCPVTYIGQALDVTQRFKQHHILLKKQRHFNNKLQDAYNSHGLPKFITLQICDTHQLDHFERVHIDRNYNEHSCNLMGAVPMRSTTLVFSKEEHSFIEDIAVKNNYPTVKAFATAIIRQYLADNH